MTSWRALLTGVVVAAAAGASSAACQPRAPGAPPSAASHPAAPPVAKGATYVGSRACAACHGAIYERWKRTPMANVVRDPREHPEAMPADPASNPIQSFEVADVAFVYGSRWKQRFFKKVGDDYFPLPVQWDVKHKTWKRYFVEKGADWWLEHYPADNMQRPTGPLCDGCHSVAYDVASKRVAEWNVGCERCHGPGSAHTADPTGVSVVNPGHLEAAEGTDVCVSCHSQGRPKKNPIAGRYFDWPVGYEVGKRLADSWELEEHRLGDATFTHFADGTGHKNRMQGNDFVQSLMYTRGVTCFDCHDAHGTANLAQLRKPATELCLGCHQPGGRNGPFEKTIEEHTHHAKGSAGDQCVGCHMPPIETTLGDVNVRAHTFKVVMPSTTDRLGVPNSCNHCHQDQSTAWATAALLGWRGRSPWRMTP